MENIELSECVYEHIKDTFYYGLFGDFKLVIDKNTGIRYDTSSSYLEMVNEKYFRKSHA